MIITEIECKSALTKSGIEGVDYALNPYVGCAHGCLYCYAIFMKRFTGHREAWGEFVDVRVNVAQVLARQLCRATPGKVLLGSVTDAYQPLEGRYSLTRACLAALCGYDCFRVCILTKSPLVTRDLDILRSIPDVEVGFTITTLDEAVRRDFEPQAAPSEERLAALDELGRNGIPTFAFVGPILPFITDNEEELNALFGCLRKVGVGRVLVDGLNLRGSQWGRVKAIIERGYPHLLAEYQALRRDQEPYRRELWALVGRLMVRHGLVWERA
ncbi:MAG: radical SAM protein [Anaerolineae bacterium]